MEPLNKALFIQHFDKSLLQLLEFTKTRCYNTFSENFEFILAPSGFEYHDAMDVFEKDNLDKIMHAAGKKLTKAEVADLLYADDKIPNWININIDQSYKHKTIVHVLATREWRPFNEALRGYPQRELFHCTVPIPPGVATDATDFQKYDINLYSKQQDRRQGGMWSRLKWFFRNLTRATKNKPV